MMLRMYCWLMAPVSKNQRSLGWACLCRREFKRAPETRGKYLICMHYPLSGRVLEQNNPPKRVIH